MKNKPNQQLPANWLKLKESLNLDNNPTNNAKLIQQHLKRLEQRYLNNQTQTK